MYQQYDCWTLAFVEKEKKTRIRSRYHCALLPTCVDPIEEEILDLYHKCNKTL